MGKKKWQTHLVGWHKPTQKELEHMQKMKKEVKTHDRKAEKKDG